MKCDNCKTELTEGSKFCNDCGTEIEIKKDSLSGLSESIKEMVKEAGLMWFTVGLIKGNCSKSKKTKKYFKEVIEKDLKKNPRFAAQYDYINSEYNKIFPQKKNK